MQRIPSKVWYKNVLCTEKSVTIIHICFTLQKTFEYDSSHWKNPEEYQPENGANLEEKETKLATFVNTFNYICLGMKAFNSSSISWLMKERSSGDSLFQIFYVNKQYVEFALEKAEWLKLLPGSSLDVSIVNFSCKVWHRRNKKARVIFRSKSDIRVWKRE